MGLTTCFESQNTYTYVARMGELVMMYLCLSGLELRDTANGQRETVIGRQHVDVGVHGGRVDVGGKEVGELVGVVVAVGRGRGQVVSCASRGPRDVTQDPPEP
jgi:hypothetical protein